ncbi:MAG: hypothetical protein Q7T83_05820, partial [Thermodesulfovibrionales bacterium]|nr:hypothetical protein [Thermodesulfovibrionales bacterium]
MLKIMDEDKEFANKKISECLNEIQTLSIRVAEDDKVIQEKEADKTVAKTEIEKLERWVNNAREMFELFDSSNVERISPLGRTRGTLPHQKEKAISSLKLTDAILKIMSMSPDVKFNSVDMADRLKKA